MRRVSFFLVGLLVCGSGSAADLFIDLVTDHPPTTFANVRVELLDREDERRSWTTLHSVALAAPYATGVRVAEFENVERRHNYFLVVQLLDGDLRPVDGRAVLYLSGDARNLGTTILVASP